MQLIYCISAFCAGIGIGIFITARGYISEIGKTTLLQSRYIDILRVERDEWKNKYNALAKKE